MQPQIQSCEIRLPSEEQARQEISSFLQAVDTYPARVAAEPSLTFHQHLCSFLDAAQSHRILRESDARHDNPFRR